MTMPKSNPQPKNIAINARNREQWRGATLPSENHVSRNRKRRQEDKGVEVSLPFETQRLLEDLIQLSPGDKRSRQRHRTDQPTDQSEDQCRSLSLAADQRDRGDCTRRAASHAVIERHHLGHGGELHRSALPPCEANADDEHGGSKDDIDDEMRPGGGADVRQH